MFFTNVCSVVINGMINREYLLFGIFYAIPGMQGLHVHEKITDKES